MTMPDVSSYYKGYIIIQKLNKYCMSDIECPSCSSRNITGIRLDRKIRSFVMVFTKAHGSRRCYQCNECGNKFQVISSGSGLKPLIQ